MTPEQMREMQKQAAAGLVAIPREQEMYLECPKCGKTEFQLESKFKMVFDRLDPSIHGMIPQVPVLTCPCGRKFVLDPAGDAVLLRDMKNQLRKLSLKEDG